MLRWRGSCSNHWKSVSPHITWGKGVGERSGVLSPPKDYPLEGSEWDIINCNNCFGNGRGHLHTGTLFSSLCLFDWLVCFVSPRGILLRGSCSVSLQGQFTEEPSRRAPAVGSPLCTGSLRLGCMGAHSESWSPDLPWPRKGTAHRHSGYTTHHLQGQGKMGNPGCLLTRGNRRMTLLQISLFWLTVASFPNHVTQAKHIAAPNS